MVNDMSQQTPQIVTGRRSQLQQGGHCITPGEAFKRGFYGGLGLWCSFMVLNIVLVLAGWLILIMLGLGAAGIHRQLDRSRDGMITTRQEPDRISSSPAR
jgi:hypothetical protein